MEPVRDTAAMIAGMRPEIIPGRWVFCTLARSRELSGAPSEALAGFQEAEGLSLVLPVERAERHGFKAGGPVQACITLTVHSALDGVGLTAAVSGALAAEGIPCNMVAAFHHDHVFVPEAEAERALAALRDLSRRAREAG